MNEMYNMSIDFHDLGVLGMMAVIAINMLVLLRTKEAAGYIKKLQIYINPASSTMIGAVIFTGIIMMAAKHLDFTIANIAMIIASVAVIVLEVKRTRLWKQIDIRTETGFGLYKAKVTKMLGIELAITAVIGIWMLIL